MFGKIRKSQVLSTAPVSDKFGFDRGTPIDRHYIETFLRVNREYIKGRVLEVGEPVYTKKFGQGVQRSMVLTQDESNEATVIRARLDEPWNLTAVADCFICTQTFNFIYEVQRAAQGARKLLVDGGVLLATVAALAPISKYDADRWGDYWRFTPQSARRLFADVFGENNVEVFVYGNSAAAALFVKGYACEDLPRGFGIDQSDPLFPVVIGIRAKV